MEMVGSVAEGASEKKMHALILAHHVCLAAAARSLWCSLPVTTANTIGTGASCRTSSGPAGCGTGSFCGSGAADCGEDSSVLARLSTFLLERNLQ